MADPTVSNTRLYIGSLPRNGMKHHRDSCPGRAADARLVFLAWIAGAGVAGPGL